MGEGGGAAIAAAAHASCPGNFTSTEVARAEEPGTASSRASLISAIRPRDGRSDTLAFEATYANQGTIRERAMARCVEQTMRAQSACLALPLIELESAAVLSMKCITSLSRSVSPTVS